MIFGRHDLVQDPPISRIDLLTCRNTLMYFTADVQTKILANFHFALNPGGHLFLGKSEALVTAKPAVPGRRPAAAHHAQGRQRHRERASSRTPPARSIRAGRANAVPKPIEAAFEHSIIGQVVLDADGTIMLANRAARRALAIGPSELGRHLREAEFSFRPIDLRGPVERVLRERRQVTIFDVLWRNPVANDEPTTIDITISPLESQGGVLISLVDVTRYQHLRQELERSQRELETAYEELQSTVEELETTNEELQSTNRRAGNHERGASFDERRTGDHERGAPVDE